MLHVGCEIVSLFLLIVSFNFNIGGSICQMLTIGIKTSDITFELLYLNFGFDDCTLGI